MSDDADANQETDSAATNERPLPGLAYPPVQVRRARRWQPVRDFFRPDRLREFGSTMTLVAPLTVLIWIWAEREQTVGSKESPVRQTFQLSLRDTGLNRSVTLASNQSDTLVVYFTGPKVGYETLNDLIKDPAKKRITLDVGDTLAAGGEYPLPIDVGLLNQQPLFKDNGLTVLAADPAAVQVKVDRQVERVVPVKLPAALQDGIQKMTAEPATVKVRGPEQQIKRLEAAGQLTAELDIANLNELRARGASTTPVPIKPIDVPGVSFSVNKVDRLTVQFAQEEQGEIKSMVVYLNKPSALESHLTATITPVVLPSVKVIGPSDVLRQLRDGQITPAPYAMITVTREDIGTHGGSRVPTFMNLPPGVRVVEGSVSPVQFDVSDTRVSEDTRREQ